MRYINKPLSVLLSLAFLISVIAALPMNASASTVRKLYELGSNISAELQVVDDSSSFKVEGTGYMYDFESDDTPIYKSNLAHYVKSVTVPEGIEGVGNCVFYGCSELTSLSLPKTLRKIGDSAFSGCGKIKKVTVPYKVTRIGEFAFYYCSSLTSIVLPLRLERIESGAFYGCDNLKTVYYAGSKAQWENMYKSSTDNDPLFNAKVVYDYHIKGGDSYISKKANFTQSGNIKTKCTLCGEYVNTKIPMLSTVSTRNVSYAYTGKYIKPTVEVKDIEGNVVDSKYYTLTYKDNLKIGTASVTVKFKGRYEGSKTVKFYIVPKGTGITAISGGAKSFKVRWKKQAVNTTGYQVQYSLNKNFKGARTVKIADKNKLLATVGKLQSGKIYYVRVRTYKKTGGVNYCSSWSAARAVRVK